MHETKPAKTTTGTLLLRLLLGLACDGVAGVLGLLALLMAASAVTSSNHIPTRESLLFLLFLTATAALFHGWARASYSAPDYGPLVSPTVPLALGGALLAASLFFSIAPSITGSTAISHIVAGGSLFAIAGLRLRRPRLRMDAPPETRTGSE